MRDGGGGRGGGGRSGRGRGQGGTGTGFMRKAGKPKLPPHVQEKVEEKARLRREDEQVHFWLEVDAAVSGIGGAASHGRCLPDTEEELFPSLGDGVGGAGEERREEEMAEAYDEIPVSVDVSRSPPTFHNQSNIAHTSNYPPIFPCVCTLTSC